MNGVSFTEANNGTAVGTFGIILRTTNRGINWISQTSGTSNTLNSVCFTDVNNGMTVGITGTILRTTNGGTTWISQTSGTSNYLNSVSIIDAYNGTAVGMTGTILRTTNGGVFVNQISSEIPERFSLYQNYPNPFNPSTKINYDIPKASYVKLIVYDVLGKKIATLVNEKLSSGSYEVDWNGSGYPSGVYFYKLTTGDYVETKKMILLK